MNPIDQVSLGLVLRAGSGAPTQAEVLAFDAEGPGEAPLGMFAAVPPTQVGHVLTMAPFAEYPVWVEAHPSSPVSVLHRHGVVAVFDTPARRDAALLAALQDPDIAGTFAPKHRGYWTYPDAPVEGEPFALLTAFSSCYGNQWWGLTPMPYGLDVTSEPIRLESFGHPSMCGVPPPQVRDVWAWHMPGLAAGSHQIDLYHVYPHGIGGLAESVFVTVLQGASGPGSAPHLVPVVDASAASLLVLACCIAAALAVHRRQENCGSSELSAR